MSRKELAAVAEALRISTREAQGLPPELTSDQPFHLVAGLIRTNQESTGATSALPGPRRIDRNDSIAGPIGA
jgi:hypothetical protein